MRAARATVVIPGLFAIASKIIVDQQMALFISFGGFTTLVVADFGSSRLDKLRAHAELAVVGSVGLVIGTLVSGTPWLAAVVTIPVAFTIFFAGVLGPVPATGTTAALFAYLLPVASQGGVSTLGSRLEGWWLVSAAGTLAVLLLSPRSPGDQLRAAASALAGEIARCLRTASGGEIPDLAAMTSATRRLQAAFTSAPFRPTGLAARDQALGSTVQMLQQGATEVADAFDGHIDVAQAIPQERQLLVIAASVFDDVARLLTGARDAPDTPAFLDELERGRTAALGRLRELSEGSGQAGRMAAAYAAHAQTVAVVARSAADTGLIAARRADPVTIAVARRHWFGIPRASSPAAERSGLVRLTDALLARTDPSARLSGVAGAPGFVVPQASVRSVWFANSLRGALALAIAVGVADVSKVGHAFWIVLGALSVLRTNASGTGATALRALGGAAIGFVLGAALLLAIGTSQTALWVAFPVAVLLAAYAPDTAPFAIGQAAFTIMSVVLFNLTAPVGWRIGLLRVEDVALGCAVSLAVGVIFWPRGASALVGDDLADAFRTGARYLTQAVDWALSERATPPEATQALAAGQRLEDAVRGFLTERGAKRASKDDLWTLVTETQRLRLAAHTLTGLREAGTPDSRAASPPPSRPLAGAQAYTGTPASARLQALAAELAGYFDRIADEVGHPGRAAPRLLSPPEPAGPAVPRQAGPEPAGAPPGEQARAPGADGSGWPHPHLLWVQEQLRQLARSAPAISEPALHMAQIRRDPWWR